MFTTDGFDTVDVAPPFMSSTENNTPGARRDEQETRFLSRENIVKMLKTTIVLSALFMSIWAVVLNQSVVSLEPTEEDESVILVETEGLDNSGTNSGHALWSIDGHSATLELDVWTGIGNDSNAGTYGELVATSNHLLFIADDGQHGHELHQYLRTSIRDQWMVWD